MWRVLWLLLALFRGRHYITFAVVRAKGVGPREVRIENLIVCPLFVAATASVKDHPEAQIRATSLLVAESRRVVHGVDAGLRRLRDWLLYTCHRVYREYCDRRVRCFL